MQYKVFLGVESLSSGDAVSNDLVGMYEALASRGVDVAVFPSSYAASLGLKMIPLDGVGSFLSRQGDIFIYHFCGHWHSGEDLLKSLNCRKIVKYHNVTPPEFFVGVNSDYEFACRLGREAIASLTGYAEMLWGDSAYNSNEFVDKGFPPEMTAVIPPFHHTSELLSTAPDDEWLQRLQDGRRNILVVGRLAPNKNHLLLIEAFALLFKQLPDVRLVITGGADERLQPYNEQVAHRISSLDIQGAVLRTGKMTSAGLAAAYRSASVFAITSLHEGFCVPLVEAMAFDVPIVALATGAVPETLGDAGRLVFEATPRAVADALTDALGEAAYSPALRRARQGRYQSLYSGSVIESRFMAAIASLLPVDEFKPRAIHQFHSGSAFGDAVTNGMLFTQQLLRDLGFESEIFVEYVAPELKTKIRHYSEWHSSPEDMLLLHHSMGHDLDKWVENLPSKNVMLYHNITPEEFFPENSPFRAYANKGRKQLERFRKHVRAAIADSPFNAKELRDYGYGDVEVIPLLFDVAQISKHPWDDALVQREASTFTVLFVGRISPNKCQHELVTVASWMKRVFTRPFQLVFVGGYDAGSLYYRRVMSEIEAHGLEDCVRLTGKVPADTLYAWYHAADVFLSFSEHEGFGVPLIEAMAFDVPVVAYKCSNVGDTMGGAGLLLTEKDPAEVAGLMKVLCDDRALCRVLIEGQRARLQAFSRLRLLAQLATFLARQGVAVRHTSNADSEEEPAVLHYQVEGPVETSYSLALVNRELAFALDRLEPGQVGVFPTEGPGDYVPMQGDLDAIPGLAALWKKGNKGARADVVIRNLYPPRVSDMAGQINLLNYAWEESGFPQAWVQEFNRRLDAVTVTSRFVKKVMIDHGVKVPVAVIGNGVDHLAKVEREHYPGELGDGFRFLHISSCFPRKGVDVLLEAYVQAFSAADDVTLIIKTFRNPHNQVEEQIDSVRESHPGCPRIVLIEDDLPAGQIADIYQRCHAFVAPSRGEGFGLPMAEAMWFGLPVITTAYGGQADFCNDDTAWLVRYRFAPAETHLGLHDSMWVEPELSDLVRCMREVRFADPARLRERCHAARSLLETDFTWDNCAKRLRQIEKTVGMTPPLARKRLRVGWISSWNAKCGIASYSAFLVNALEPSNFDFVIFASKNDVLIGDDGANVRRCWTDKMDFVDDLLRELDAAQLDIIVLQHNFVFMSVPELGRLLNFAEQQDIPVIVEFHSTKDVMFRSEMVSLGQIAAELKTVGRILVHGVEDLNRLRKWGLVDNVALFPHGVLTRPAGDRKSARLAVGIPVNAQVIATYGFMLPHKGMEELLRAFPRIVQHFPDAYLLMVNSEYPVPASAETLGRCRDLIKQLQLEDRVTMMTEFLADDQSLAALDAASLIVFPYQETGESASGAVRYGLATGRPVVCSPLGIFDDVRDVVHFLPGTSEPDIAFGVVKLLSDELLLNSKEAQQARWLESRSWNKMGDRFGGMISSLAVTNRKCANACHELKK